MEIMNKLITNKMKKKMEKKVSIGRQKIEIKKIEKESARQVAFTKRRQGVMKKASELSILCGVEFAFLAFSPGGNPYSFGHPSFDSVVTRFLTRSRVSDTGAEDAAAWHLNQQYTDMERQHEAAIGMRLAAEERLAAAAAAVGEVMRKALVEDELDGLSVEELEMASRAIEEASRRVEKRKEEMLFRTELSRTSSSAWPASVTGSAVSSGGVAAGSSANIDDEKTTRIIMRVGVERFDHDI